MIIKPIKTSKIVVGDTSITKILDEFVVSFQESSILAITSKIVSICQGRVVKTTEVNKKDLIYREAQLLFPPEKSKYNISITIKDNFLIPTAGIDESNGNGYFILWPNNPQQVANQLREYLCQKFGVKLAGVIITDSKTTPLRLGTSGTGLAHSGFLALNSYIDKPDLFGRHLKVTQSNILDGLAAAAVLVMGEGDEQTPLATLSDLSFVQFQDHDPTKEELDSLTISLEEDLYAPLLTAVPWVKGKGS